MAEEGGEKLGPKMSKRFNGGEVDYNNKAGTAWSHSFLNQKPWHPLSYPNQRRKWIAEQTHAQRERRADEVAREFAQEQEFFRQTAMVSEKEKDKMEMMKAVSFMYVRPPGYNAESAKAAENADEGGGDEEGNQQHNGASTAVMAPTRDQEKKKSVPKDVFGRALPTEEQFEVLKNAPRLETGAPARPKPFAVEVRNVKCLRCGKFGHQSGDRECPLKDAIMPNEESRLQRDDPLTTMMAHAESHEPLKWELKQKPGMSPPRGGFDPDDPNQQIVAEDIFDEYGGFLAGENIPDLLANFTSGKPKKKSKSKKKHKRRSSPSSNKSRYHEEESSSDDDDNRQKSKKRHHRNKKRKHSESSSSDHDEKVRKNEAYGDNDDDRPGSRSRSNSKKGRDKIKYSHIDPRSSDHGKKNEAYDHDDDERAGTRSKKRDNNKTEYRYSEPNYLSGDGEFDKRRKKSRHRHSYSSDELSQGSPIGKRSRRREDGDFSNDDNGSSKKRQYKAKKSKRFDSSFSGEEKVKQNVAYDNYDERTWLRSKKRNDNGTKRGDGEYDERHKRSRHKCSYSPDDSAFDESHRSKHHQSYRNR